MKGKNVRALEIGADALDTVIEQLVSVEELSFGMYMQTGLAIILWFEHRGEMDGSYNLAAKFACYRVARLILIDELTLEDARDALIKEEIRYSQMDLDDPYVLQNLDV